MNQLLIGQISLTVGFSLIVVIGIITAFCIEVKSLLVRFSIMAVSMVFILIFYLSMPLIMGWSTPLPLPKEYTPLMAVTKGQEAKKQEGQQNQESGEAGKPVTVNEEKDHSSQDIGSKMSKDKGEKIYLWLKENGVPRSHEMPFDPELYSKLQEAMKEAQEKNEWVFIKGNDIENPKEGGAIGYMYDRRDRSMDIKLLKPQDVITK